MKKILYILAIFALVFLLGIVFFSLFRGITPSDQITDRRGAHPETDVNMEGDRIRLPRAATAGGMSLTEALMLRRSVRSYSSEPMHIGQVAQLLWSAQGINAENGFRTAPSAGATFPLELFVMVNNVTGVAQGIYHFDLAEKSLVTVHLGNRSGDLVRASLSQAMIRDAAVVIIFGAVFERTTARYGERGIRYVYNEVGHASQNLHLQAAALNLGTVVIGAFRDEEVEDVLDLGEEIRVLYLMPVGPVN